MEDVADLAGRSRTTLYTYFRGRNDLVLAIRHRLHPETHALFQRIAELVEPTHEQVRQWVDDLAEVFERRRVEWAISMEALSEPALHDSLQADMQAAITVLIEAIGQARSDGRRPRRARVEILFSQLLYTMHLVVIRDVFGDRDDVMDELARVWFEELRES
ncbi:TetR/AcrR family transcriptional regulator [Nocardia salmonicida]|uniref:TetR/AcrR family transcriptional regulator n=1 Tax=Nocardia salmonicida TaxID=53431 RepID=A0ABZ1N338_9NOCA